MKIALITGITGQDGAYLAELIKNIVGYEGAIVWNTNKPDGTPRKLLDVSLIHRLGWQHQIQLEDGIRALYHDKFLS